jgi:signal transduction histidine kinase
LGRRRLALLLTTPVALLAIAVIITSLIALANIDPVPGSTTDAGLARIGDNLVFVIVAERGPELTAARALIINWGIIAPTALLIVGAMIAWWLSGRVTGTIDAALTSVTNAEQERQGRMQEVVHELRTPLAIMGTNLELAAYGAQPEGESAGYIEVARRAVGRMSRTVADLEDHGALAVAMEREPVDLSLVGKAIVDENSGPAMSVGVRVTSAPGLQNPLVVDGADMAAIGTAAGNFMSNALRMAPRGSEVVVNSGELNGWAWLSVTDQGPGIPAGLHSRAFERGWQGAHDRDRHNGSGLGLTIARQLTEAQGGLITIESEEGGGATFALWLPIDPEASPESILAADRIHPQNTPWVPVPATL